MPASALPEANDRRSRGSTSWAAWGWIARVLVVLVFGVAAYGKVRNPAEFAAQIRAYEMVPHGFTNAMALVLPWLEVLVCVLLLTGVWRREARWVTAVMLVVFIIAKINIEVRGLHISCGCFGGALAAFDKVLSGPMGIVMNVVLLALLGVDAIAQRRTTTPSQLTNGGVAPS